jgi:hypothetical protein
MLGQTIFQEVLRAPWTLDERCYEFLSLFQALPLMPQKPRKKPPHLGMTMRANVELRLCGNRTVRASRHI